MTFSDEIRKVDTCRVYHSGPRYFVEIDIVLPPEMPLWKAHDISQDLQDQIEALPDVDRCFVHVDHEVSHKPVSQWSPSLLTRRNIERSNERASPTHRFPACIQIHDVYAIDGARLNAVISGWLRTVRRSYSAVHQTYSAARHVERKATCKNGYFKSPCDGLRP